MKKFIILVFLTSFLLSCGPKRMGCGARGICKTSEVNIKHFSKENGNLQMAKI
jgi:hypothetical protein